VEEYIKDYDNWNERAKALNGKAFDGSFAEREIWWCALGINIGSEEDGKNEQFERPVIIFRKFGEETLWIIPLSSKPNQGNSRVLYSFTINGAIQTAKLSQLRLISERRLLRYMATISYEDFQNLRKLLASCM
jgi:mRNA-degrading endonuclease toxin of MazEF toxin-antitoxin module